MIKHLMNQDLLNSKDKEEWRDFLLKEVVSFLQNHKDDILTRYQIESSGKLSMDQIEHHGLMDFDVSISLHCDQRSSFGLGFGFFKANVIR